MRWCGYGAVINRIDGGWTLGHRLLVQGVRNGILKLMAANKILINRAPVLTLWASVVSKGKETRTTS
jgi:hypothetical protein